MGFHVQITFPSRSKTFRTVQTGVGFKLFKIWNNVMDIQFVLPQLHFILKSHFAGFAFEFPAKRTGCQVSNYIYADVNSASSRWRRNNLKGANMHVVHIKPRTISHQIFRDEVM